MTIHELLLATAGRWLGLLALAMLIGALVIDVLIVPPGVVELAPVRRRLRRWGGLAVAVLIATSAGDLVTRARIMSGGDLAQIGAALPLVLTRTHFGAVWIARSIALTLLVVVSMLRSRAARVVALVLALGVALTSTLTGHAASSGDHSFTVLVDWLHAVAASAWTGGLFGLAVTMRGAWEGSSPELAGRVARRFSRLAGYCLLVVVASGIYNACVQVPTLAALWTTTYGAALLLKILLALALAFLGAINRYLILPALGPHRSRRVGRVRRLCRVALFGAAADTGSTRVRLSRFVRREALIAVAVFGCTAVLGESTPKSHPGHASHLADRGYTGPN